MMTQKSLVLMFALVLLLSLLVIGASSAAKMPPGSFATRPVANSADLANLVEQDHVVGLRYSDHYGMSTAQLVKYFKENLMVATLSKTRTFTVYYLTPSGRVVTHKKTLKAGSKVLISPSGDPVIELRCGNPLGKTLPIVQKTQASIQQLGKPTTPTAVPSTTPVPATVATPTPEVPDLTQVAAVPPTTVTEAVPAAPGPVQEAVLATPPFELPLAAAGAGWIVPTLLGAGAVGALVGSHGGSSTTPPQPPPVPEPSSLVVIGMGVIGLAGQFSKRMRR